MPPCPKDASITLFPLWQIPTPVHSVSLQFVRIELVCNITSMCKVHCVSNSDCVWIITGTATYTWTVWRIPLEVFPAEYVTQSVCTVCTGYKCLFIHRQNTDRRIRRCRWSCMCHADLDTVACYRRHSWAARPLSTARTARNDCTHIHTGILFKHLTYQQAYAMDSLRVRKLM